jgi:TPR repeat protein
MCGAVLEPRRPSGAPVLDPLSAFPKTANAQEPPQAKEESKLSGQASRQTSASVSSAGSSSKGSAAGVRSSFSTPSISTPSMLGLDLPADQFGSSSVSSSSESNQPSADTLREKSFSGLDSFFEPEPKSGGGRVVLLLVLLAALAGAGWWVYTNYLSLTQNRKPEVASNTTEAPADMSSTKPAGQAATQAGSQSSTQSSTQTAAQSANQPESGTPESNAGPSSAGSAQTGGTSPASPSAGAVPEGPSENATVPAAESNPNAAATKPAPATSPNVTRENRVVATHEPRGAAAKPTPEPVATAAGGDADFRKGEAYLYGRGVPENCDEAVKYLKSASAQDNAKARSAFGTMYATGHCVARDLPTSYLWFAMALRLDPNNQILEKDLTAIWNQMTPPERQMATRMKQ